MQTIAERCVAQHLALGNFFFSRSDSTRNTSGVLIPTLAYQLTQLFPSARQVIDPILLHDPLIFKKSLQVQLHSLLVQPLRHLVQLGDVSGAPYTPRVFLIDGLDECNDATQQQAIIQAVVSLCHEHRIPVKFLIASRPELDISASFGLYKGDNMVLGSISLSDDPDAERDIRRFIEAAFLKIRSQHPFKQMIPPKWPVVYDVNRLVWKSSSHFIYASTVLKYVWLARENPVRSLQVVLGLQPSRTISPFSELDALYHHILGAAAHRDKVLQVIAHCVYISLRPSTSMVCSMLQCSADDLLIYLADVAPLLTLSGRRDDQVKLLHASLGDFLRHSSRSGHLYVNEGVYLASTLGRYLQLSDACGLPQPRQGNLFEYYFRITTNTTLYNSLKAQILKTIRKAGHLVVAQEVLAQYSLLDFYARRPCVRDPAWTLPGAVFDLLQLFLAVHSIVRFSVCFLSSNNANVEPIQKSSDGTTLFKDSAEHFLNILNSPLCPESTPLAAAIITVIFIGYPAQDLCNTLSLRLNDHTSWEPTALKAALAAISGADLTSIRHSINAPAERTAVAVEAILGYLFDEGIGARYSRSPSKRQQQIDKFITKAPNLLDALLWALPKAGMSEKIALYSERTPLHNIAQREGVRVLLVQKCLQEYNMRMQEIKLELLNQRIEIGEQQRLWCHPAFYLTSFQIQVMSTP